MPSLLRSRTADNESIPRVVRMLLGWCHLILGRLPTFPGHQFGSAMIGGPTDCASAAAEARRKNCQNTNDLARRRRSAASACWAANRSSNALHLRHLALRHPITDQLRDPVLAKRLAEVDRAALVTHALFVERERNRTLTVGIE